MAERVACLPTCLISATIITTIDRAGLTARDLDDVKEMFSSMSLKIMAFTYAISMAHMVLDLLAFKNDVGFFKARKDFTGLSTRSLATSCICSLIIFLYHLR